MQIISNPNEIKHLRSNIRPKSRIFGSQEPLTSLEALSIYFFTAYPVIRFAYMFVTPGFGLTTIVDELLIIACLYFSIIGLFFCILNYKNNTYISFIFIYFFSSFLGYAVNGRSYGIYFSQSILGLIYDSKFFLLLFAFYYLFLTRRITERHVKLFLLSAVIFSSLNYIFIIHDLLLRHDIYGNALLTRNGQPLPSGLVGHKTPSAQIHLLGFIASISLYFYEKKAWIYVFMAVVNFLAVFIHQGSKEIIAVMAFLCVLLYFVNIHSVIKIFLLLSSAVFLTLIITAGMSLSEVGFLSRIQFYLSDEGVDSARRMLWVAATNISSDYFPFGTGAGSFGSEPSRSQNFSSVYSAYGIDGYGMNEFDSSFLLDNYWAKILGESGLVGLISVVLFNVSVIGAMLYTLRFGVKFKNSNKKWIAFDLYSSGIIVSSLICSFGSSVYSSEVMFPTFAVAASYFLAKRNYVKILGRELINTR